jgi:hypothetical protein
MLRKSIKEWDSIYRTIGKTYYNRENVDLPMGIRIKDEFNKEVIWVGILVHRITYRSGLVS